MLRKFINKKLAENKKPLSELYSQVGISQNSYYWGLKKNSFNPDVLAKMAAFLKVNVDDINANIEKTDGVRTRKQRTIKAGRSKITLPVVPDVVKKIRKLRKSKTAEILTPAVTEVINIKKRVRKPGTIQSLSVKPVDSDLKMMTMELDYLRQMLIIKDEMIDLLKQK
ncbi:MAG: hypothetical protein NTW49_00645 [Bacteroidia bacterium]|nr:hypothetical protein [Bacteroidia bacterium]